MRLTSVTRDERRKNGRIAQLRKDRRPALYGLFVGADKVNSWPMRDPKLRVESCSDYELHFHVDPEKHQLIAGIVAAYFPLERCACAQRFIPCPGLIDRSSPDFDSNARRISKENSTAFSIASDGIRLSAPYFTGITAVIDYLRATGGFKHVFYPSKLPEARWDNIRIEPCPLPIGVADFCDNLQRLYTNGFVVGHAYRISDGALEEIVLSQKCWSMTPAARVELFRHPQLMRAFGIGSVSEELLFASENWTSYSPFLFSGFLAQTLVWGGSYLNMRNDVEKALAIADSAFKELNRNYQNFELQVCSRPWMGSFFDVAWDNTWVILDRDMRRLIVLLASDTD